MNILMVTNTYSPFVGGVARSVESFTDEFRRLGHRVMVVAPAFTDAPGNETDVVRVPAIQKFNGSDFSLRLPIPGFLFSALEEFRPDVVHSHHPYLLGDTALRISAFRNAPLVFTHHSMYEKFTHYVPGDSPRLQRFIVELSTGYANLCDRVIAPSGSTAKILEGRGVETPIEVIPTGIDYDRFQAGDGAAFRASMGIPEEAFLVGHIGRLSPEKNLGFLVEAVTAFLDANDRARFLVAGVGPSEKEISESFERRGMSERLHFTGILRGKELACAYHAMNVFAFASQSETQGLVLAEAMAAGIPVVAVDAPGVREVVVDCRNGFLLPDMNIASFSGALSRAAGMPADDRNSMRDAARETARSFSIRRCAEKALLLYEFLRTIRLRSRETRGILLDSARRIFAREWELWMNRAHAAGAALSADGNP